LEGFWLTCGRFVTTDTIGLFDDGNDWAFYSDLVGFPLQLECTVQIDILYLVKLFLPTEFEEFLDGPIYHGVS
jgi:hypothetical protein